MKFISLSWFAKFSYRSFLEYKIEQMVANRDKTLKLIEACIDVRVKLARSKCERAENMMVVLDTMITLLDTRMTLIKISLTDLDCHQMMYNAFGVKTGDGFTEIDEVNAQFDRAFLDLSNSLQGAK